MGNIYDFEVQESNGEDYRLSVYKGDAMLIVNTVSECGFAPQFEGLQELYNKYKDQRFTVLSLPCNQSGGQEPGPGAETNQNRKTSYGVIFPIHEKVDVKGDSQHPLFRYLTSQAKGMLSGRIKWNFVKFLVGREGDIVQRSPPQRRPTQVEKDIEKLL